MQHVTSCILHSPAHSSAGSQPSFPSQRSFSRGSHQFSLSGSFGKFGRKSTGYFVQSDQPYADSGSGDSDSSSDSVPPGMYSSSVPSQAGAGPSRHKSVDISHGRLARSNSLLQTVFSHIGKRKKQATIPISQNELIDRLKKLIVFSVDTAVFLGTVYYTCLYNIMIC